MRIHPAGRFDNSARAYRHITAVPLASAMGAEIRGVSIANLRDEQFPEIEDALYRHKMIFFRDQDMSHDDQESFTKRFGDFGVDAYTKGTAGHENVQPLIKEAETRLQHIFGSGWHTDSPFMEQPPSVSTLYGVDIPPYGGDTIWCNLALAYDYLSDTMKSVLAPLKVWMSGAGVIENIRREAQRQEVQDGKSDPTEVGDLELDINTRKMIEGWFHPIIRTHPKSGEKALYVDASYARGIEGMTEHEAEGLLSFLRVHVTEPAFSCRLRWEPGTFTLWDNRLCIHQAFNDYDGFRREMYRTTVLGEIPR
jgi:taurine dioxygenase